MKQAIAHPKLALPETDVGYGDLFAVLIRRKYWLLGTLCLVLPIAALFTIVRNPLYESFLQILIEPNYRDRSAPGSVDLRLLERSLSGSPAFEVDYATQIQLLKSSSLIERGMELLQSEYPDLSVEEVKENLQVSRVEGEDDTQTKLIQVNYVSSDPEKSQRILQVMQRVYLNYNLEQQQQRLNNGLSFVDEQLSVAQQEVARAELSLERFRERLALVDPEQRAAEISEALNRVIQERQDLRAQYEEMQSTYADLQRQLARSPQQVLIASRLSQSERYQTLLSEIQQTELALAEQQVIYTENSPIVRQLQKQYQNQLEVLGAEAARVMGTEPDLADPSALRAEGQLGQIDLDLASQMIKAQIALQGSTARDRTLAQIEGRLRQEFDRLPQVISEYGRLQPEIDIKRETLQQLLKARQELSIELARGGFNWQVVEEPLLGEKVTPGLKTNLLLGTVVGLFLGVIAAFIREAIDDTVHDPDEFSKVSELPLLSHIPKFPEAYLKSQNVVSNPTMPPILQTMNWLPFRESLDLANRTIQSITEASALKTLVVTSAQPQQGKTTIALGLALSASRLGKRVLVIDADLRFPSLHTKLGIPNQAGLSTLLTSADAEPALQQVRTIQVLTAGPPIADPLPLLHSVRMRDWMQFCHVNYDLVIIDVPPVLGMADAIEVASLSDGVILVNRIGSVSRSAFMHSVIALSGLNTVGVIVNGVDKSRYRYGYIQRIEAQSQFSELFSSTNGQLPVSDHHTLKN